MVGTLTAYALLPLAPEIAVAGAALLILTLDTFSREKRGFVALALGLIGVAVAFGATVYHLSVGTETTLFADTLVVDAFALFFNTAILAVTALVLVSSTEYIDRFYPDGKENLTEFVVLVLFATTGMLLMASARSLVTAFVALELAALPSYALVGFARKNEASTEGAMKYFLLGALSSAVLLYGISLVYGATGTFDLNGVAESLAEAETFGLAGTGALLILVGFGFKVTAFPFHVWAPDAYTGAPTPVSAFLSSASKIAGFVLLFRVFTVAFPTTLNWLLAVQILAVATMTYGNFAAAAQTSVKRMLAYSSIGHAGYVLIALAVFSGADADSAFALGAGMSHLFVYALMNTGAFLVVALVDDYWGFGHEFEDYAGIARQVPVVSVAMAIFMLSLAGLPTGGGFLSKLAVFAGAVNSGFWWLALLGVVNSALSLYYYTRVLRWMWIEEPNEGAPTIEKKPVGIYTAIFVAAVGTVVLLFAFGPVLSTATEAAEALLG
ncbi:MAG: NADH-quinone oxidoreductase subunit N [Halobacteriales archaeon]|nr:NADH-quinone oxidoreductase subunit N [Halobacteriales archaeon]